MGGRLLQILSHLCSWVSCSHLLPCPRLWGAHFWLGQSLSYVHIHRWVLAFETPFQVSGSFQARHLNELSPGILEQLGIPIRLLGGSGVISSLYMQFVNLGCLYYSCTGGAKMAFQWKGQWVPFPSSVILVHGCSLKSWGKLKKIILRLGPTMNRWN